MRAVGIVRGKDGAHSFELPKPEIKNPDDVLVRIKQVGLDGTDYAIIRNKKYDIAEDRNEMAMGHEMVGVVEATGTGVKGIAPGEPVTMTVRRGCGICESCLHNQSDMCMTGLYTERGIHKLDGYLTQFVVDREQYVVKVPPKITHLAVFTEPVSIAEKAMEQVKIIQSRLPWTCPHPQHTFDSEDWGSCKNALVLGAGPLGLLATALLRLDGVQTWTADIVPPDSAKAQYVERMGAYYIDSRDKTAEELVESCSLGGDINIVIEASGAAATALDLINNLARSSIYVMTGIPGEGMLAQVDAAQIVRKIVRENQVIVGSVNSNRSHFEMALRDIAKINGSFEGILADMITHRYSLDDFKQAFAPKDAKHIKTIIEVEPW